jgi:hypothetical protein
VRTKRLPSILITLLASASAISCAAVLGFERLSTEDGFVIDSGSEAGDGGTIQVDAEAGAGAVDAGPCGEIGLPAEPVGAADAGGPPLLVALSVLDFAPSVVPGFNLDRTCSIDLASSSCKTNVLEPTFDRHAKDKSATGLDNASFSLIDSLGSLSNLLTAPTIDRGIADGKYGAVLRITGWNGQADDDDVQIEIFPAIGLLPRADADAGFAPSDQWILDRRFQADADASRLKTVRAWVTGSQLVGRFAEISLPVFLDQDPKPFDIRLTDAILTATLATTSLTNGTVAGRWKTADLLDEMRTIFVKDANGLSNTVLCEPVSAAQLLYGSLKKEVCDARDIRGDGNDTAGLGCDAVSAAMRIEGYPVTNLGVFDAGAPVPARCEVDGAVPPGDDCAPN